MILSNRGSSQRRHPPFPPLPMSPIPPSLQEALDEWLEYDQNESTRKEIVELRDAQDWNELTKRLGSRIEFGTAGLRARMQAGFNSMNDLTVIQASQGLAAYVLATNPEAKQKGLVVGHDHRHNSRRWAELTAAVFLEKGMKVVLYEGLVHTPLVPFGVKTLGAAVGVMITASHNPKNDNGYKVYWSNAIQIISPHDTGIAASILANLKPFISWDTSSVRAHPLCEDKTEKMKDAYFEHINSLSRTRTTNPSSPITFVHTALHGVGTPFFLRAFKAFDFPAPGLCEEQMDPDPEFPTVPFPNPEEKGALDLAMKHATSIGAQVVLANDPDADRFTAAERNGDGWTVFTGDQIGSLFASWVLDGYKASGKPMDRLAIVASTVSSKMIASMARTEGFKFVESLTGFKYIGNKTEELANAGFEVPFGYEEAIGYMLSQKIRDKDGVSAAACFAELASSLYSRGSNLKAHLEELYAKYGTFITRNSYFICNDPSTTEKIFQRLRYAFPSSDEDETPSVPLPHSVDPNPLVFGQDGTPVVVSRSQAAVVETQSALPRNLGPFQPPTSLGGLPITSVRDLTLGYDSTNAPSYEPDLPNSGGEMITWIAGVEGGERVVLTVRTSGTEPKIKYYLEGSGPSVSRVEEILTKVVEELGESWMEVERNGLKRA
ncbi:phosphoglucomutase 1 [Mrakia frigida]|uniref:phosphoribomutase PRM15 n=1 Tax=Mrakia frigida TaxID=29902 RepID=UPI003FCC2064